MQPLFEPIQPVAAYPERLTVMHKMFGISTGNHCGQCVFFERYSKGSTWFKCELSHKSASKASDWRARWPACGKFEEA